MIKVVTAAKLSYDQPLVRWYRAGELSVVVSEPFSPLPFGTPPQSSSQWDAGPTQVVEIVLVVDVHPWA